MANDIELNGSDLDGSGGFPLETFADTLGISDGLAERIIFNVIGLTDLIAIIGDPGRLWSVDFSNTFEGVTDDLDGVPVLQDPGVWALQDYLQVSDTYSSNLILTIRDSLALSDVLTRILIQTSYSLSDSIAFSQNVKSILKIALTDTFELAEEVEIGKVVAKIRDVLRISDSVLAEITRQYSISDNLSLSDFLDLHYILTFADALALADSVVDKIRQIYHISGLFNLSDSFSNTLSLNIFFADAISLDDSFSDIIQTRLAISDTFNILGSLRIDGETYLVWAFNPKTLGAYKLSYPKNVNSFARIGGKNLVCAEDGIYAIGGDDDDGETFRAFVKTGFLNFHDPERHYDGTKLKQLLNAYLVFTAEGTTLLKVTTTRRDEALETWFVCRDTPPIMAKRKLDLSYDLRSVLFQFELTPLNDDPAKYTQLEIVPLFLNRSI